MAMEQDVVYAPRAAEPVVAWGAVIAGSLTALAVSLMLTVLAAGFGLSLAWPGLATRGSLAAFAPELGAYAVAVQVVSAAFGGYLAGRMRHVWSSIHDHEAHFRDTAHGVIVWALSTVAAAALAAAVLSPYADQLAGVAGQPITISPDIAAQSSFFIAVGMLLSAFTAAVAARIVGIHTEHMHAKGR